MIDKRWITMSICIILILLSLIGSSRIDLTGRGGASVCGEIYIFGNEAETVIHTQSRYHNVTVGVTMGECSMFSFDGSGNLTVSVAGMYDVSLTGTFHGTNNKEYHLALGVNAVRSVKVHHRIKMAATGDDVSLAASGFVRLVVGDRVNIMVENVDGINNLILHDANLNLIWIGD